jgi:WD40 repeat protein
LRELRRGADKAEIYCLSFSPSSNWLAISSDKGTIHVYGIGQPASPENSVTSSQEKDEGAKTRLSSLSFMKEILPSYFSSEWSFAQFHVQETRSLVCFGNDKNSIIGNNY